LLSELEAALLELDGKRNDLELVGSNAVGVILTGMGDDGASGMSR